MHLLGATAIPCAQGVVTTLTFESPRLSADLTPLASLERYPGPLMAFQEWCAQDLAHYCYLVVENPGRLAGLNCRGS